MFMIKMNGDDEVDNTIRVRLFEAVNVFEYARRSLHAV